MAALTYGWSQGERMESVVETAGTDPGTAADTVAADGVTAATTAQGLEAAVISALATLQADGASPTEAHVDTLQTAWDALKTALDALELSATTTKTATALTVPADTIEVHIKTGQKASDLIVGLDSIKARIATSKVLAP